LTGNDGDVGLCVKKSLFANDDVIYGWIERKFSGRHLACVRAGYKNMPAIRRPATVRKPYIGFSLTSSEARFPAATSTCRTSGA
jgi:hypothetical protein